MSHIIIVISILLNFALIVIYHIFCSVLSIKTNLRKHDNVTYLYGYYQSYLLQHRNAYSFAVYANDPGSENA